MRIAVVLMMVTAMMGADLARSESLGEVARRERERRKAKASGKVITESELGRAKGSKVANPDDASVAPQSSAAEIAPAKDAPATGAGAATGGATAAGAAAAPVPKTEEEIRAESEQAWRDRVTATNAEISKLRSEISRLEGSRGVFADQGAKGQLDSYKSQLAGAESRLASLEDERRQNGYR